MCTKKLKIPDIFGLTMSFPNLRVKKQMCDGGQILGCRLKDWERGRCWEFGGTWPVLGSRGSFLSWKRGRVVMFGHPGGGISSILGTSRHWCWGTLSTWKQQVEQVNQVHQGETKNHSWCFDVTDDGKWWHMLMRFATLLFWFKCTLVLQPVVHKIQKRQVILLAAGHKSRILNLRAPIFGLGLVIKSQYFAWRWYLRVNIWSK